MSKIKIFLSDSLNPYLNLATEEWIFLNLEPSSQVLFLWRNEETVVIGRNQNPWSECNLAQMNQDKVHLARRTTGGGAVYHDRGNTNFTFLSPKDSYRKENNVRIILDALKEFGIRGEASGRNDLLIPFAEGARKFSGSAYRESRDRAFHHGTLLLDADLTRLVNYLTPNPKKLQAKGTESVRSRVINLKEVLNSDSVELHHESIADSLIRSFENFYGQKAQIEHLNMDSLQEIAALKNQFVQLSSWQWLYGHTLEFNLKMDGYFALGFFEFQFKVDECIIKDVQIFTDCLYLELVQKLSVSLRDQPLMAHKIRQVFAQIQEDFSELSEGLMELENWILHQLEV